MAKIKKNVTEKSEQKHLAEKEKMAEQKSEEANSLFEKAQLLMKEANEIFKKAQEKSKQSSKEVKAIVKAKEKIVEKQIKKSVSLSAKAGGSNTAKVYNSVNIKPVTMMLGIRKAGTVAVLHTVGTSTITEVHETNVETACTSSNRTEMETVKLTAKISCQGTTNIAKKQKLDDNV